MLIRSARALIADGLAALDEAAHSSGISLGLEPIHPVGLLTKGCINTIAQARTLIKPLRTTGLILDLFHSWWGSDLINTFRKVRDKIRLVQVCNVLMEDDTPPTRSPEFDRGLLRISKIHGDIRAAGYIGSFEFEIFATDHDRAAIKPLLSEAKAWFETCTTR
jgi:sugar phosphate isomerase/epimerase